MSDKRRIPVTGRNLWFLEKSIPLFSLMDFFPPDVIGPPAFGAGSRRGRAVKRLIIDTDQGWGFETDIPSDQKIFRNSARTRGSGKWVRQAALKPGDRIIIQRLEKYRYRLAKESGGD